MRTLDLAVILAYLIGTVAPGVCFSRGQRSMRDYWRRAYGTDSHYLRASRWFIAWWDIVQVGVAVVATGVSRSVVNEVLEIASFTNGVILGGFLLGTLTAGRERPALVGSVAGSIAMLSVRSVVSWQWYVLIGSMVTLAAGWIADAASGRRRFVQVA